MGPDLKRKLDAEAKAKRAAYMRNYMRSRPEKRERQRIVRLARRAENPELLRAQERASKARNRDKVLERKRLYRQAAAAKIREYNKAYARRNAGKMRAWRAKWEQENVDALPRRRRERRIAETRATPAWADRVAINEVYDRCTRISRCTGIPFHVDHVIPLRGEDICGLHIHSNLQVIPAYQNYLKANKLAV
jgi:hypothetical protein